MKRWICAAALFFLAGCTAVSGVPTPLKTQGGAIQQSGGPFSAAFNGTIGELTCNPFMGAHFVFSGTGKATFFGRRPKFAIERGGLSGTYHPYGCSSWAGSAILSIGNPSVGSIDFHLSSNSITKGCVRGAQFTVTGGTGRFANAAGSGTVAFSCSGNTYTDQWSGTITF